jgi:hypothetical protein
MNLRDYRPAGGWALLAAVLTGLLGLGLGTVIIAHDQATRTSVILPAARTSTPAPRIVQGLTGRRPRAPRATHRAPRTSLGASRAFPG